MEIKEWKYNNKTWIEITLTKVKVFKLSIRIE